MEKVINIDGRDVKFKATAATIRMYRMQFGRDMLIDFRELEKAMSDATAGGKDLTSESLTIFENIAYVMAKQADPDIEPTADEWLDTFNMFSIYLILPQIVELWKLSELPTATSKKKV